MTENLTNVVNGGSMMAGVVIAVFFLRFWRQTKDRLFALFALSFAVLAVNRLLLSLLDPANEARTYVYAMRFVAFVLIIAAIVDKNIAGRSRS